MGAIGTGKPKNTKVDITPELAKQVAESVLDGETTNQIIQAVNLSYPIVKRIMRSPEFTAEVKNILRNRIANLAGKTVNVIEQQLEQGSLDAAKTVLKVLGVVDQETNQGGGDQNITVILPGNAPVQPKDVAVEATSYVITDDQPSGNQSD